MTVVWNIFHVQLVVSLVESGRGGGGTGSVPLLLSLSKTRIYEAGAQEREEIIKKILSLLCKLLASAGPIFLSLFIYSLAGVDWWRYIVYSSSS